MSYKSQKRLEIIQVKVIKKIQKIVRFGCKLFFSRKKEVFFERVFKMNILHMKYAVEVARIGSINKAAEELYIAQSNLSRCIKDLEADLGIVIFDRSFRGMVLTR